MFGDRKGLIIRNESPGSHLMVVIGHPTNELLAEALIGRTGTELLCVTESAPAMAKALPDWTSELVRVYELAEAARLAPPDVRVRALQTTDLLAHLPLDLQEDLSSTMSERQVLCTFEQGLAASFAYSYWRTESQFDISIDTAPQFRRRGLARLTVSELIRQELSRGFRPVWGAMESNMASQQLAVQLGFVPTEGLQLFRQP